jgi:hypothetical protein
MHMLMIKNRPAVLLCLLLILPLVARAELEVHFTPIGGVVAVAADGVVSRSNNHLSLILSTLTITGNPKFEKPAKLHSLRVAMVLRKANGQGEITHWSEPAKLEVDIGPGEVLKLKNIAGVIPIEGVTALTNRWLAVECRFTYEGVTLSTFGYSSRTLFDAQSE